MCEICGHTPCVPRCPEYDYRGPRCALCGTPLGDVRAWQREGVAVCDDCLPGLDAGDLFLLTGKSDAAGLLEELGFWRA